VCATILSLITVAATWLFARPLFSLPLLCAAGVGIYSIFFFNFLKSDAAN